MTELEAALRRLTQDPENQELQAEARALLLRRSPDDLAARARLCALAIAQQPRGQERAEGFVEPIDSVMGGTLALSPGGRFVLSTKNHWDAGEYGSGPLLAIARTLTIEGPETGIGVTCYHPSRMDDFEYSFSPDGLSLLFAQGEEVCRSLRVRDFEGSCDIVLGADQRSTDLPISHAVARFPDGAVLALADERALELIHLRGGEIHIDRLSSSGADALAFQHKGRGLAAAIEPGRLEVFDLERGLSSEHTGPGFVEELVWGSDGSLYALGHEGLWVISGRREGLQRSDARGEHLTLGLGGRIAITLGSSLQFWNIQRLELLAEVETPPGLADLAIDEERGRLVAVFEDGALGFWAW